MPSSPTVSTNNCGSKTLTRGTLPSGVTWYWQGIDSNGTSTANSSSTYTANSSGTYYLRARDNTTGCWGLAAAVLVTVNPIPATPTVASSSRIGAGVVTLSVSTPVTGDTYLWYSASSGGTAFHTGNTFSPSLSSTKTYFVSARSSKGCESGRKAVMATIHPFPVITVSSGSTNLVPGAGVTLALAYTYSTYQWYRDGVAIAGATREVFVSNDPGSYSVLVTKSGSINTATSIGIQVRLARDGQNMNYVVENIVIRRGVLSAEEADGLPVGDLMQKITYFDGLGRELQTVQTQASPSGSDIVSPVSYDVFGRVDKAYLPYVMGQGGAYRPDALEGDKELESFYSSTSTENPLNKDIAKTNHPWAVPVYEASPLNRVLKQGAPGEAWQPDGLPAGTSTDHAIKSIQRTNAAGEARLWKVSSAGAYESSVHDNPMGNAALLNGTGSYVQLGSTPDLKMSDAVTVEAWIYPTGAGSHSTYGGIIAGREGEYLIARSPEGTIRWVFANSSPGWAWTVSSATAPLNTWTHVAMTYGNNTVNVYINGILVDSKGVSGEIADEKPTQNAFRIGGREFMSQFFQGAIDEVRVWKGERTEDEIRSNMYKPLVAQTNLAGYWRMSEGKGSTVGDASGQDNNGSLVDATWRPQGFYAPGTLYVTETRDEQHALTVEYKDLQGLVVAKKVQEADDIPDTEAETGFMVTQYVYDELGNLRLVLQPEGVRQLPDADASTGKITLQQESPFVANWCFRYEYDGRRRVTRKQVPGAGEVQVAYSRRDLPVLAQDAEQRQREEWAFTKYDQLGRPVMTGTVTLQGKDLAAVQAELDLETVHHEEGAPSDAEVGYTLHNSYPRGLSEADVLTVTYYDTYNYLPIQGGAYAFTGDTGKRAPSVRGQVTGTRTRRVEGLTHGAWLTAVSFYDKEYRLLESVSDSHLGYVDRLATTYRDDLSGLVEETQLTHREGSAMARTVKVSYTYDHMVRLLTTSQTTDGMDTVLLSRNAYNELGQLVDKGLHSRDYDPVTGQGSFLQSVDYRYNIRGWLTSINNASLSADARNDDSGDVFGMEFTYENPTALSYKNGAGSLSTAKSYFNGNISEMVWQSSSDNAQRAYSYGYDRSSRLTTANYHTQGTGGEDYRMWGVGYDANGNIQTMNRAGLVSEAGGEKSYGRIDALSYHYEPEKGNLLLGVDDTQTTASEHDFEDKNGRKYTALALEYGYDENGNMIRDDNKGITQVEYNRLNLPSRIEFDNGAGWIEYTYTASGEKLQKRVSENGVVKTTDYAAGFVYEQGQPVFVHTSEGRALYLPDTDQEWRYEYHLKDHLGNLRVSVAEPVTTTSELTMEPMMARVEEEEFDRVEETRHLDRMRARTGSHAALLSAGSGSPMGPAKRVELHKGDTLKARAYGLYETERKKDLVFSLASWLASSAMVSATTVGPGEHGAAGKKGKGLPFLGAGLALAPQVVQKEKGAPKAYLRYIVYDSDSNYVESGYHALSGEANKGWEELELEYAAQQDGFAEVYLANESAEETWFDDMSVTVAQDMLVQENHYDPWGLNLVGIEKQGAPDHKFQYNGIEKQSDLGLNVFMAKYRTLDPQLGRWWQIDPKVEALEALTPYNSNLNNPVRYDDPEGDLPPALWGAIIGAGLGAGIEYGAQVYNNYSSSGTLSSETFTNVNGTKILAAGAEGLIAGAVAGATGNLALGKSMAANSVAQVVGGGVKRAINGEKVINAGAILTDAAAGAAGGAAANIITNQLTKKGASEAAARTVTSATGKAVLTKAVEKLPSAAGRAAAKTTVKKASETIKEKAKEPPKKELKTPI